MITSVGLPLLIVNGKFQSLSSMTVKDLETFIPFLVRCSLNWDETKMVNGVPIWWSSIVKFKFPLQKPKGLSEMGYLKYLCKIVYSCYWYYDAQYLLPFCATIAKKPESVVFKSNNDSTTSIYYAHKPIQIMSFNNLNKMYDIKPKTKVKEYRTLLPQFKKQTLITDVYLCENCDAEFTSHLDMLKHENECSVIVYNNNTNHKETVSNESDDEIQIIKHIKVIKNSVVEQSTFLSFLELENKNSQNISSNSTIKKHSSVIYTNKWINAEKFLHKNRNIEFSSYCGRKILKNLKNYNVNNKIEKSIAFNELYCCNNFMLTREVKGMLNNKVTFKNGKRKNWVHQYSFNKRQRISRYRTLKYGLSERSRKLLKLCSQRIPIVILHRIKHLP